jgi:DNA helicase-2/ATP-dependent DNA helicase PcrA
LLANGVIQDYSQCVLLLRSAQNSAHYAGPYQAALEAQNIPVYNPRSKDYLEQAEVAQCLGAFVRIIDPQLNHLQAVLGRSASLVQNLVDEYDALALNSIELANYVSNGAGAVRAKGTGELITADTPTILYRILSHQPFVGYQANPERDLRLSKLTRLFEAFCAQYGRQLRTDDIVAGELPGWWYGNFYYGLCGYLAQERLNDDEDEDVVCPTGYFPIMTVHQAKGLEFEFVFVGNLGISVWDSSAHHLEQDLRPFRHNPPAVVHPIADAPCTMTFGNTSLLTRAQSSL